MIILIGINFVSASFTKGNYSIETKYAPGDKLKGWINISLQNEAASNYLSAFNSNISILDFLKNNELDTSDYSCFPADCETGYSASNKETSKTFSLNFGNKKTLGLKINEGIIDEISIFSMNITSDATESSYPQLFIDILNDNNIEWQSYSSSGNFGSEIYGCYKQADSTEQAEITTTEYCEKITFSLPYTPNAKIGADIIAILGGGNVSFEMRIYNDNDNADCTASASGSGKISCVANLIISADKEFFVCIKTKNSADNNKYKISYEQNAPCGFSGSYNGYNYDFAIFAQAGKYIPIGSFVLNDNELEKSGSETTDIESYIEDYIEDKYESNCTNGCVIPIKFISGKQQTITVSDVSLTYAAGITTTTHDIYDLTEESAKINMGFQKLDLEKANLIVPSSYGEKTLSLKLSNEEILSKKIEIAKVPIIEQVIPLSVPAAMSVRFIVFVSDAIEYKWNFGDNTEENTTTNSTYHTYSKTGTYNLKITTKNKIGEASKTFFINVRSPKDEIKIVLVEKRENLNATIKSIKNITAWYKGEIEKKAALDETESKLKNLEKEYAEASTSDEYVEIMSNLMELKVPNSLKIEKSSGDFFPNAEGINTDYLIKLGVKGENVEKYKNPIANWFNENIEMKVESSTPYLYYTDEQIPLLTVFTLKIKPKKDFDKESYLIIDKSYDEITFREDYREKAVEEATAITFSELKQNEEKIIELIFPEKTEILALPLYISPEFSELPEETEISPCDNDKICEKEEETEENCPNDCHKRPWKKIIIWMLVLLFAAFVVYVILQEWYKKYYEGHLFKNKNDVFNLINFIVNAQNQGLSEREIIKKLKDYKWSGEQIAYAFKKMRGERTGMWEIPIFRWFEKRKMREELRIRQQQGLLHLPVGR